MSYGYLQVSMSVLEGQITDIWLERYPDVGRGSNERSLAVLPPLLGGVLNSQSESLNYGGITGASATVTVWKAVLHELFVKAGL